MIGSERNGGADALLAFLIETLRPEIAARYPQTARAAQILFGHSLGGLFAAHALLTRPGPFDAFIVSSPSLYWSQLAVLPPLPAFTDRVASLPPQQRAFVHHFGNAEHLPPSCTRGYAGPQ